MKTEFQFIENLKKRYKISKIGDDAAVMPKDSKTDLVISTDLLIEEIDFRLKWTRPEFIGHKALAVSISDVAAMGAKPVWSMISIGVPQKIWKTDFVDRFYEGYMNLAEKFKIDLVGGDVSKTPGKIVIDSIAAGEVKKGKAVLRSNARAGDLIFVTGDLGGASGGLRLLENGIFYDESPEVWQKNLLLKQLKPMPAVMDDLSSFATSMIDISDGLSGDLFHICAASRVGAKIYADKIPFNKNLKNLSGENKQKLLSENLDILDFALNGGEDFELLFTIKPNNFEKILKKFSGQISHIGEITENVETIELIKNGKSKILEPKSFRHF